VANVAGAISSFLNIRRQVFLGDRAQSGHLLSLEGRNQLVVDEMSWKLEVG
jgi:hypothetical protein